MGTVLGFSFGFMRGLEAGRKSGKIQGWLFAYSEIISKLKTSKDLSVVDEPIFMQAKTRTVLLIDDNDDFRHILAMILKFYGYEVYEAALGKEGLRIVKKHNPDVVIIDISLPDISGFEVVAKLNSRFSHLKIKKIALTGLTCVDSRDSAIKLGFDVFMTKPYNLTDLIKEIG